MKILHFSSAKTWRGGEQQIAYLQEELDKKGIEQWIFCVANSALANYCQKHGITYITYKKRFSTNPFVAYQLKKWCAKLKIDLVHLHDSHSHTFGYISALIGNEIPLVLSRRVDFPVKNSWLSYQKYNHPLIKKILSVSNYVQQILAPAIKDKSKLTVVHSGIDLNRFKANNQNVLREEFRLDKETILIGNIAAIAPHKDYFTFVDTAEKLMKSGLKIKFFIIGADGGEEQAVKKYMTQKGLVTDFIFTGFRKDIPQILPVLDVFLFTSKEEGLGTSVIDALACGVPIVATNAGGIPEIINSAKSGLLSNIGDSTSLAENVKQILVKPLLKKKLVRNGLKTAQQFSKKVMAEKTLKAYQEILQ